MYKKLTNIAYKDYWDRSVNVCCKQDKCFICIFLESTWTLNV